MITGFYFRFKSHLVSLLPTEANTVLDGEFVGGLAGAGQSGRVTTVFEAAQVPWHCRETRRGWKKRSVTHNLEAICIKRWLLAYEGFPLWFIAGISPWFVFYETHHHTLHALNPHVPRPSFLTLIIMFVINILRHQPAPKEQSMVTHSIKYSGLCLNVLVWIANCQANYLASEEKRRGGGGREREGRRVKGTGMFMS